MITPELSPLYAKHLFHRINQFHQAMTNCVYEHLVIDCGHPHGRFMDDTSYPFRLNPWAARLAPLQNFPGSFLVIESGAVKPNLYLYQPRDFWHAVESLNCPEILNQFHVFAFADKQDILKQLPNHPQVAYIGEQPSLLDQAAANPSDLLNQLSFEQAVKTDYEIACIAKANQIAAKAHTHIAGLFEQGCDELSLHLGYLQSAQMTDQELPYDNIIACNQHAAILHYTRRDKTISDPHSLLIDAGATYNNYCADISRSYCLDASSQFGQLIKAMNKLQLNLIDTIQPGIGYASLHIQAVNAIGELLIEQELISCGIDEAVDKGLVSVFFPHGLGHLLGVQVHDCGGYLVDPHGREMPPPEQHPFLRLTRTLAPGQVVTIEPGLYFIEQLFEQACAQGHGQLLNRQRFEQLAPFGGIRIEDDVQILESGCVNLTRHAFSSLDDYILEPVDAKNPA